MKNWMTDAILETEDETCDEVECHPNLHIEKGHHH